MSEHNWITIDFKTFTSKIKERVDLFPQWSAIHFVIGIFITWSISGTKSKKEQDDTTTVYI